MVNTVIYRSAEWLNADGLVVRFGRDAAIEAVAGSPTSQGPYQNATWDIVWDRLPAYQSAVTTGMIYGGYPNQYLPAGAVIHSATLSVTTNFAGTGAALSLGLVDVTGKDASAWFTNNTDADEFFLDPTQGAVTNLIVGADVTLQTQFLNYTLPTTYDTYYLWAAVTTASFTAGQARFKVEYFTPQTTSYDV